MTNNNKIFDYIGIGIGPSNLSLCALAEPKNISLKSFDRKAEFSWHSGMLFKDSELQVSYLKDLVTPVDPTNPYSFLSYLSDKGRIYNFLNAKFRRVLRSEFNQYMKWVTGKFSNLEFNKEVVDIDFDGDKFIINSKDGSIHFAKNISLGTGLTPKYPNGIAPCDSKKAFHAINFLEKNNRYREKHVTVIGGGQSGAEIVGQLLSNDEDLPSKITWITGRLNFLPIDDSPFVEDLFTPSYANYYFNKAIEEKKKLVEEQNLYSDGIYKNLLEKIYQRLYELKFIEEKGELVDFKTNINVLSIDTSTSKEQLTYSYLNVQEGSYYSKESDIVIFCTGFKYSTPPFLNKLLPYLKTYEKDKYMVNDDYSIQWKNGQERNKIYLLNGLREQKGVADPNLSLMAWRSAKVINSIANKEVYKVNNDSIFMNYESRTNNSLKL